MNLIQIFRLKKSESWLIVSVLGLHDVIYMGLGMKLNICIIHNISIVYIYDYFI